MINPPVTLRSVLEGAAKVARDIGAHLSGNPFSDGHRTGVHWSVRWIVGDEVWEALLEAAADRSDYEAVKLRQQVVVERFLKHPDLQHHSGL